LRKGGGEEGHGRRGKQSEHIVDTLTTKEKKRGGKKEGKKEGGSC